MNPQQKQRQQKRSPSNNPSSSSSLPVKLILSGIGIISLLIAVQSLSGRFSSSKQLPLKKIELNPTATSAKKAQAEAPRYGLDDKTVSQEQVTINLRDNGVEDGDYVTLFVNSQAFTPSTFIANAAQSITIPLNPGANLIEITADRDGVGGVTLGADVSDQSNMVSSAIPVGSKAAFYIIRR